jgi:hypothetical protein
MRGTGKWRHEGVPHKGWICVGIEDLCDTDDRDEVTFEICEMCEVQEIRYVHEMRHRDYPVPLFVGCVCAGHMEKDLAGARMREHDFKKRSAQKSKWLQRRWRVSHSGNSYVNADGFNVVVFRRSGRWSARIKHSATGYEQFLQPHYETAKHAKLAAFDAMVGMKASPELHGLQEQLQERMRQWI